MKYILHSKPVNGLANRQILSRSARWALRSACAFLARCLAVLAACRRRQQFAHTALFSEPWVCHAPVHPAPRSTTRLIGKEDRHIITSKTSLSSWLAGYLKETGDLLFGSKAFHSTKDRRGRPSKAVHPQHLQRGYVYPSEYRHARAPLLGLRQERHRQLVPCRIAFYGHLYGTGEETAVLSITCEITSAADIRSLRRMRARFEQPPGMVRGICLF